jgi:replicative DNA helicase
VLVDFILKEQSLSEKFFDLDAEISTLSAVMNYGLTAYLDVSDLLTAETFVDDYNQAIWSCLKYIFRDNQEKEIDIPTMMGAIKALGLSGILDNPAGRDHLRKVKSFPVARDTISEEAATVLKLSVIAKMDVTAAGVRKNLVKLTGRESLDHIINSFEIPFVNLVTEINGGNNNGTVRMGDGISDWMENIKSNPFKSPAIPTPHPILNSQLGGGWRRGACHVTGARPGNGKTSEVCTEGLWCSSNLGIPCCIIDTEMCQSDLQTKMIAQLSGLPVTEIETGSFVGNKIKEKKVDDAVKHLESIPLHYIRVGDNFEQTLSTIRRWVNINVPLDEDGVRPSCVVILDYLQSNDVSQYSKNVQEQQILGSMMLKLIDLASKLDITVSAFVQLNRTGITKDDTSVIANSDRIVQKAASIALLKKKSKEEIDELGGSGGNAKITVVKSRFGPGTDDMDHICLNFNFLTSKITEVGTYFDIMKNRGVTSNKGFAVEDSEEVF